MGEPRHLGSIFWEPKKLGKVRHFGSIFPEYDIFLQMNAAKRGAVHVHCVESDRPSAHGFWVGQVRDGVGQGGQYKRWRRAALWRWAGGQNGVGERQSRGKWAGRRGGHTAWTGVENEAGGMGRKNVLKIQNATKMSYFHDSGFIQHVTFLSHLVRNSLNNNKIQNG